MITLCHALLIGTMPILLPRTRSRLLNGQRAWFYHTTNSCNKIHGKPMAEGRCLRLAVKPIVYWNLGSSWSLGWCPGTLGSTPGSVTVINGYKYTHNNIILQTVQYTSMLHRYKVSARGTRGVEGVVTCMPTVLTHVTGIKIIGHWSLDYHKKKCTGRFDSVDFLNCEVTTHFL